MKDKIPMIESAKLIVFISRKIARKYPMKPLPLGPVDVEYGTEYTKLIIIWEDFKNKDNYPTPIFFSLNIK